MKKTRLGYPAASRREFKKAPVETGALDLAFGFGLWIWITRGQLDPNGIKGSSYLLVAASPILERGA